MMVVLSATLSASGKTRAVFAQSGRSLRGVSAYDSPDHNDCMIWCSRVVRPRAASPGGGEGRV